MLIGNVGKEPEIRYIDNGVCTAQISLATSTPLDIRCKMELKYLNVQSGIVFCYGED